jgi:hypothetical protein
MSGQELIVWLLGECNFRKLPPTDSALILVLRELHDINAAVRTIRHGAVAQPEQEK